MRALLLGPDRPAFIERLAAFGDEVNNFDGSLNASSGVLAGADFIISYGYRYIIKGDLLDLFPRRVINLHISLLPWNRGADPNLWSFLEDTPKGVTVHFMDAGLDTGDVIAARAVDYKPDDTLRSSYARLSASIEDLFFEVWPVIREGRAVGAPQKAGGSYHNASDKAPYERLLTAGWDTPVSGLIGMALKRDKR